MTGPPSSSRSTPSTPRGAMSSRRCAHLSISSSKSCAQEHPSYSCGRSMRDDVTNGTVGGHVRIDRYFLRRRTCSPLAADGQQQSDGLNPRSSVNSHSRPSEILPKFYSAGTAALPMFDDRYRGVNSGGFG